MNLWLHQLYRRASSGELSLTRTWWARGLLDWVHTGVVVVRQTGEDKLHVRAATLAYWSAVGFVPLLVLAFALTAPIGVKEAALDAVRDLLYESLLVSNENQVIQVVETLLDRVDLKTLGWLGVGGIMMIGSQIYYASELAYNDVFNTQIRRNWFFRFFMFNAVIVGVPVCIAGGMILSSRLAESLSFSGWWASLLLTTVALVSAIKVLPNTRVDWSAAITGGVISAALVEFSKYGFSTYMDLLGTKDNMTRLYGSVAFLPVFLLWLNVLWLVVLMGVELAFVVQNRRTLVEAQAERAGDPHAMWRRPDGLFAVGVTVALAQAEAASENGTASRKRRRCALVARGCVYELTSQLQYGMEDDRVEVPGHVVLDLERERRFQPSLVGERHLEEPGGDPSGGQAHHDLGLGLLDGLEDGACGCEHGGVVRGSAVLGRFGLEGEEVLHLVTTEASLEDGCLDAVPAEVEPDDVAGHYLSLQSSHRGVLRRIRMVTSIVRAESPM